MTQQLMFRDLSIAALTGTDQVAIALNGNRQFLLIENTGNANIGVNLTGLTAAIAGTGTVTIVPGGSILLDHVVPQNAIHVIGTAGQPVCVVEA